VLFGSTFSEKKAIQVELHVQFAMPICLMVARTLNNRLHNIAAVKMHNVAYSFLFFYSYKSKSSVYYLQ
jgi:hypothetical protein